MAWMFPITLLLSAACSDDNKFARLGGKDEFDQAPDNKVDILWVIDNSISMQNEQESVAAGTEDFIVNLETGDMDFHVGVITTDVSGTNSNAGVLLGNPPVLTSSCRDDGNDADCQYADQFRERVLQGTQGDDQERGLEAAVMALSPPLADTRNADFLRDEASLAIIVVSDENDCSDFGALGGDGTGEECYESAEKLKPVPDIVTMIKALKSDSSKITLSGIVGPEQLANCDQTYPGTRYYSAISSLSGVKADICETEYSVIMDQLGLIASGILTTFQLSKAAVEGSIEVTVTQDGTETVVPEDPTTGWTYLVDTAQVQFNGDSVPQRGAHVVIEYDIAGPVPEDTGATE